MNMKKRKIFIGDLKIGKREKKAINKILESSRISEGERTKQFEVEWAKFIGTKYSVVTSSGTGALICGLNALMYHSKFKLKKGQKIITSPLTYIATSNAIVVSGFKPIYADINPKTFSPPSKQPRTPPYSNYPYYPK